MCCFFCLIICGISGVSTAFGQDTLTVDIFGPGQRQVNIVILPPRTLDEGRYKGRGNSELPLPVEAKTFDKELRHDISFLPFLNVVPLGQILGGDPSRGVKPGQVDLKPLRLSKVDFALTTGWTVMPDGEKKVSLRFIGTFNGRTVVGKRYSQVKQELLGDIADKFCSHVMKQLTGHAGFFESTIAFVRKNGDNKEIFTVSPQGRGLHQVSHLGGVNLSPCWSIDGKKMAFTRLGARQHLLCMWDSATGRIDQKNLPGNTVISPTYLPDGRLAVTLTLNGDSDIYLLDSDLKPDKPLAKSWAIEVSPDFDKTGKKMVFVSGKYGNPHIFMLNMDTGKITRVTYDGKYNTNPTISPDGRFVAFSRQTSEGHRIFVHDMLSGAEKQLTFGPGNDEDPAFGPDGYFIAFTSSRTGGYKIYMTTRHGDPAMLVPTGKGEATSPAWKGPLGSK
jgi:TolB protein